MSILKMLRHGVCFSLKSSGNDDDDASQLLDPLRLPIPSHRVIVCPRRDILGFLSWFSFSVEKLYSEILVFQ